MIEFPKEIYKKTDFKPAAKKPEPMPFSQVKSFPLFLHLGQMNEELQRFWMEVLKNQKEEQGENIQPQMPPVMLFAANNMQTLAEVKPISSTASVEGAALLNKMADAIIHMEDSGITETKILLNASEFSNSPFYGSEIIIQEFSTAPKAFNIQFNSSLAGLALFQTHIAPMMAAFHKGNFAFSINRLDGYLKEEKPLVARKETVSEDQKQDEKGHR